MERISSFKVAVIGAGIAGATCAHVLSRAGLDVHVVDKARGAGGRLATRRLEWKDPTGRARITALDHGAPAFTATNEFRQFLASIFAPGGVVEWTPTLDVGSRPLDDAQPLYLPCPDMPSLCRGLLRDIAATGSFAVDRLVRSPRGWQLEAAGSALPGHFNAVVLALPPAQAAPLLAPYRPDWAHCAALIQMQPCWTLMGVSRRPTTARRWDVARPAEGPLDWIVRNDARPSRASVADEAHWVAHARADWSRQHIEEPSAWVQARMEAALQDWVGETIEWQHAVVHRWRYARPQASKAGPVRQFWWDAESGLGVCGDFLGGTDVEGAWLSAQALIGSVLADVATAQARQRAPELPAVEVPAS
jgi:predicted NAD/FAD-dependent oxidoreductase